MRGKSFFDTTILIYSVSSDESRSAIAERLLADGGYVSVQVLNEFAAVARRKLSMPWEDITDALLAIRALCESPMPLSITTHDAALEIAAFPRPLHSKSLGPWATPLLWGRSELPIV
jgi:predicted nucleic acid-binding protein